MAVGAKGATAKEVQTVRFDPHLPFLLRPCLSLQTQLQALTMIGTSADMQIGAKGTKWSPSIHKGRTEETRQDWIDMYALMLLLCALCMICIPEHFYDLPAST